MKYEVTISDKPKCNNSDNIYFQFSSVENYSIIGGFDKLLEISGEPPLKIDSNLANTQVLNSNSNKPQQITVTDIQKIAQEITVKTESLIKKINKGIQNPSFVITNGKQLAYVIRGSEDELVIINLNVFVSRKGAKAQKIAPREW